MPDLSIQYSSLITLDRSTPSLNTGKHRSTLIGDDGAAVRQVVAKLQVTLSYFRLGHYFPVNKLTIPSWEG